MKNIFKKILFVCPLPALIIFCITLISAVVHAFLYVSKGFADFVNLHIASVVRMVLAKLTNLFPFSLAETLLLFMPVIVVSLIIFVIRIPRDDVVKMKRCTFSLLAAIGYLYSTFALGFAASYRGTSLADKLGLERTAVSAEELDFTARALYNEIEKLVPEIEYIYASSSVMPYNLDEMNVRLNEAYAKASEKYDFINHFRSNLKYVTLSEPMTYTHISGVYTFFTGEANINVNFPDYTTPFTSAHELSHQRGIGPEDEANFMAFLVCIESDDTYIKYSGYMEVFEYVISALYKTDKDKYYSLMDETDRRVRYEISAYNKFFEKYRESKVSEVSSAVNDTYLKSQGQSAGSKSYGMVVDLAVAYYRDR
ncbi:MAG: DUF3810 domain-containing protein [Firmicutes bacterium]|nr:DUF3810 domain-containing protein [Bacillota bacterium]